MYKIPVVGLLESHKFTIMQLIITSFKAKETVFLLCLFHSKHVSVL